MLGFFRQLPQQAGLFLSNGLFQFDLVLPLARAELTAVATGRAPADPVRFGNNDVKALFGTVQGGRKAGIASADDAHVAVDFT